MFANGSTITAGSALTWVDTTPTAPFVGYNTCGNLVWSPINKQIPTPIKKNETSENYELLCSVPGIELENISVYIRNSFLCIRIDAKGSPFEELIADYDYDIADLDIVDAIDATLKNGILTVVLSKKTPDKQITVKR